MDETRELTGGWLKEEVDETRELTVGWLEEFSEPWSKVCPCQSQGS